MTGRLQLRGLVLGHLRAEWQVLVRLEPSLSQVLAETWHIRGSISERKAHVILHFILIPFLRFQIDDID